MKENNTISEKFSAGQVIFEEGQIGDCAYIIESGRVQVYIDNNGEELPLKIFGVGEIFGEMAVIDAQARSASAKALTDCELVVVSSSQISERINESDPIVKLLISILLQRMRNVNQQTKTLNMSNVKAFDLAEMEGLSQEISNQVDEKRSYILDKMKLETDGKLLAEIKNSIKRKTDQSIRSSYGIYETDYEEDYIYCVYQTSKIQGINEEIDFGDREELPDSP